MENVKWSYWESKGVIDKLYFKLSKQHLKRNKKFLLKWHFKINKESTTLSFVVNVFNIDFIYISMQIGSINKNGIYKKRVIYVSKNLLGFYI
jgi:hypothetical protein